MGSEKTYKYRNKLESGCSNKRRLTWEEVTSGMKYDHINVIGFRITEAFNKIYPTEKRWLMDDPYNQVRSCIHDYVIDRDINSSDLRTQTGLLRDIMIRSTNTGEQMVLVQFKFQEEGDEQRVHGPLQYVVDSLPQMTSLSYVDSQKCNDTFGDQTAVVFKGKGHITETMGDLKFKAVVKNFYQTNAS